MTEYIKARVRRLGRAAPQLALTDDELREAITAPVDTAQKVCEHDWQYLERQPGETYTGYCEQCSKCDEIVQIPQ